MYRYCLTEAVVVDIINMVTIKVASCALQYLKPKMFVAIFCAIFSFRLSFFYSAEQRSEWRRPTSFERSSPSALTTLAVGAAPFFSRASSLHLHIAGIVYRRYGNVTSKFSQLGMDSLDNYCWSNSLRQALRKLYAVVQWSNSLRQALRQALRRCTMSNICSCYVVY